MIVAHVPSGYVLGRMLQKYNPNAVYVLIAAFIGGVLPDFDMFWFYFVDDRAFHHHRYWVHIPAFWAAVAVVTLPLIAALKRSLLSAALAFFAAIFLHLCLDTIAGGILWHWPWSDRLSSLIHVQSIHNNWVLNFVFHPVFLLELMIWAVALWLWKTRT